jgi:hypothetical protein
VEKQVHHTLISAQSHSLAQDVTVCGSMQENIMFGESGCYRARTHASQADTQWCCQYQTKANKNVLSSVQIVANRTNTPE